MLIACILGSYSKRNWIYVLLQINERGRVTLSHPKRLLQKKKGRQALLDGQQHTGSLKGKQDIALPYKQKKKRIIIDDSLMQEAEANVLLIDSLDAYAIFQIGAQGGIQGLLSFLPTITIVPYGVGRLV